MQRIEIQLEQNWDTLDDAIDYFLDVVLDLKALKRLPSQPMDLYLSVESPNMTDGAYDDLTITLTNL